MIDDSYNKYMEQSRKLILATLVLTGIITEEQLNQLIESGEEIPETWQETVTRLRELKND